MAQIGTFKRTKTGFSGQIRTLALDRTGEKAGDYISLQLDDPTFARPIRANLFQADEAGMAFTLLWSRPPRRNETA